MTFGLSKRGSTPPSAFPHRLLVPQVRRPIGLGPTSYWTRSNSYWTRSATYWTRSATYWTRSNSYRTRSNSYWTRSRSYWNRSNSYWTRSATYWNRSATPIGLGRRPIGTPKDAPTGAQVPDSRAADPQGPRNQADLAS